MVNDHSMKVICEFRALFIIFGTDVEILHVSLKAVPATDWPLSK